MNVEIEVKIQTYISCSGWIPTVKFSSCYSKDVNSRYDVIITAMLVLSQVSSQGDEQLIGTLSSK